MVKFPKRAVVTAGMPNGNKEIHIGHICTFIWADTTARFLAQSIGRENVLCLSAVDSYGSMVTEKFRAWQKEGFKGTAADVIKKFHSINLKTLSEYGIGLSTFGATCLDPLKSVHEEMSAEVFRTLAKNGTMKKVSSLMFYDEKLNMFLNGRQVSGRCPITDCKSEEAYADECALGHQYSPVELIDPVSKLSDMRPVLKECANYYFDTPRYKDYLSRLANEWGKRTDIRAAMIKEMKDFLGFPHIYVHEKNVTAVDAIANTLPAHKRMENQKNIILEFAKVEQREAAAKILFERGIRFRTGKTLTPLRITGNSDWGVPVPGEDLTFYVWPESLWAPFSETINHLNISKSNLTWKDFWCSVDSKVYQVIGEDNIYFYTLCEPALFRALDWGLSLPTVISNKHILFGGAKAASSGAKRAPTAAELLTKYTPDQIKMYFLALNIPYAASEFRSKAFYPEKFGNEEDPFIAPGNILTNIFNRIVRSVFFTVAKHFDCRLPKGAASSEVSKQSQETLEAFETNALNFEWNKNIALLDVYFRNANKVWAKQMTDSAKTGDTAAVKQTVVDTLCVIRTGLVMLYCITPKSCELVARNLNLSYDVFDWNKRAGDFYKFAKNPDLRISELESKFDFFKKHPSQFA